MGYIRHDAIVVTGTLKAHITKARRRAEELGLQVSKLVLSPLNGYWSFLIAPDGSKEGWSESDDGDRMRREWIGEMTIPSNRHLVDWAHINFGGDDPQKASMLAHNT